MIQFPIQEISLRPVGFVFRYPSLFFGNLGLNTVLSNDNELTLFCQSVFLTKQYFEGVFNLKIDYIFL